MPINRHFDLIAPLYERATRDKLGTRLHPQRMRLLLPDLPRGGVGRAPGWMLDAAGGTGRLAAQFAPLVERLVVCDLSMPMLRFAAGRGDALTVARVERLPFPSGSFSRILVADAFHHIGAQETVLRELARVLAPGGRLVIEELDIRVTAVKVIALIETLLLMGSRFRTPAWIGEQMERAGLRVEVVCEEATAWVVGVK